MRINYAVKDILKSTPIYSLTLRYRRARQIANWRQQGRPIPPPSIVKQSIVIEHARRFQYDTLIETGTFMGDMIDATKGIFKQIYSIELSEPLHEQAKERFKEYDHITLLQGDSGERLPQLLSTLNAPCICWLDGHYSGDVTAKGEKETPILAEIQALLNHSSRTHVILIDDARCFTGEGDYPSLKELQNIIAPYHHEYDFDVQDDIIRMIPRDVARRPSS